MASRANDVPKDQAVGVKTYGAPMGYQAPSNAGRPVAAPAKAQAVKAAMAADTGTTKPMPSKPVPRYDASQPLASQSSPGAGIGGAAKSRSVMDKVDKMQR